MEVPLRSAGAGLPEASPEPERSAALRLVDEVDIFRYNNATSVTGTWGFGVMLVPVLVARVQFARFDIL